MDIQLTSLRWLGLLMVKILWILSKTSSGVANCLLPLIPLSLLQSLRLLMLPKWVTSGLFPAIMSPDASQQFYAIDWRKLCLILFTEWRNTVEKHYISSRTCLKSSSTANFFKLFLKVDLVKAFDSMDWEPTSNFLCAINVFIACIVACSLHVLTQLFYDDLWKSWRFSRGKGHKTERAFVSLCLCFLY